MWLVSVCAGMAILQSSLTDACSSMIVALAAVGGMVLAELLVDYVSGGRSIRDGSAVTSALVLSLLLPNHIPPGLVFLSSLFAMLVIKHSFGGLGANWVNPAVGGWLCIRLGWPQAFTIALKDSSLTFLFASLDKGFLDPLGSPLGILKINGIGTGSLDTTLTAFLNNTLFSLTGAELPGGYIDLLVYSGPGIIADRGILALLLGTIIITATEVNRFWIPLSSLAVYGLFVRIFGALPFGGLWGEGDILFGLFSGGTLAAAFLLAADPSTGSKSNIGSLITALLMGIFSFIFRYWGYEPYGAFFAIALLNVLVPLIRYFEMRLFYSPNGPSREVSSGVSHD
jgi:electron transport complex protein RnfD